MSEHRTFEQLMTLLDGGAPAFTPTPGEPTYATRLPDREPGANLESSAPLPTGAAAVVLECGISRVEPYTHVLWISPSAEVILGSHSFERLGNAIGSLEHVERSQWEGHDRLHVRAPGVDWDDMLALARHAVSQLMP